jgi:hypothetical protein
MTDTDARFDVTYGGWNSSPRSTRFATLGDLASQAAGTAVDISDLEKVMVTVSNTGTGTVKIQGSYDGSDWVTLTSFSSASGSYLIPAPFKLIRANKTAHSNGTAHCYCGGVHAQGSQRFGTLGNFTSSVAGTSVDVSDLDSITVVAEYVDTGTFVATGTVDIEISQDKGTTWAKAPGSSSITGAGTFSIAVPCQLVRANCSAYTVGTLNIRYGGVNNDLLG